VTTHHPLSSSSVYVTMLMTINKRRCDERALKGSAWRGCSQAENHVKLATMVGGGVLSSSKTNEAE
jgi:hypothetical protein